MKQYPKQALALVKKLWAKEPARVVSVVAAAVVFIAASLGVVLPHESVLSAVGFVLPILLGGEVIRSQVSPVAKV